MGVVVKYRSMGDMMFNDSGDIMIDHDHYPYRHVKASKFRPRAKTPSGWLDSRAQEDRIQHPLAGKKLDAVAATNNEHRLNQHSKHHGEDDDDDLRRMVPLLAAVGWQSCQRLEGAADPDKRTPEADCNKKPFDWSVRGEPPSLWDSCKLKAGDGSVKSAKLWVSSPALESRRRRRQRRLPMRKLQLARAKLQQSQDASSAEQLSVVLTAAAAKTGVVSNGRETMTLASGQRKLDNELARDCRYGTPMAGQASGCINATAVRVWDATDDGQVAGQLQWRPPSEPDCEGDGPGREAAQPLSIVGVQGQAGRGGDGGGVGSPSERQPLASLQQQRAASSVDGQQAAPNDRCTGAQAAAANSLALSSREPDNNKNIATRTVNPQASSKIQENNQKQQVRTVGQLAESSSSGAASSSTTPLTNDQIRPPTPTTSTIETPTTVSYKSMGSCRDSVLQLANQARAKSGCYKVAQLQHQELAPEGAGSASMDMEASDNMAETSGQIGYCGLVARQERRLATHHSRTGRSPISLQRLTNNRLAKHKLKIQQQRQEQLARLTLQREPRRTASDQIGQLVAATQDITQHTNSIEHQISRENLDFLNSHQGRRWANSGQRPDTYIQIEEDFSSSLEPRDYRPEQQPQDFRPAFRSGPIELLASLVARITRRERARPSPSTDSRPVGAGFSGLVGFAGHEASAQSATGVHGNRQLGFTCVSPESGNVLAYNSINMLRSSETTCSSFMAHGNAANNGRHRSRDNHQTSPQAREQANDYFNCNFDSQTIDSTISSASSTISLNKPFCKVCHMGNLKDGDKLISPCKCSGTMQYIHCGCLLKWLEVSNRSNEKPMCCELCGHEYVWHKRFNFKGMQFPKCSVKDIVLHLMFVLAISIMLFSAIAPMLRKHSQEQAAFLAPSAGSSLAPTQQQPQATSGREPNQLATHQSYPFSQATRIKHHLGSSPTGQLAHDEKFMLICAASFFMSFFLAIYVQTKARDTLYGLLVKFMNMNRTYYITEYEHDQHNQQQQHQQPQQQHQQASQQTSNQQGTNNDGLSGSSATSNNLKRSTDCNHRQSSTRNFGSRFADIKGLVMQKQ